MSNDKPNCYLCGVNEVDLSALGLTGSQFGITYLRPTTSENQEGKIIGSHARTICLRCLAIRQTQDRAVELRSPVPCRVVGRRPYSTNPADAYLSVVLVQFKDDFDNGTPYATWVQNHDCAGLSHGHYFTEPDEAIRDFYNR